MPQDIAIHGVLIPALAGVALIVALIIADAVLHSKVRRRVGVRSGGLLAWLHARLGGGVVLAPALAVVSILSFHARQGVKWPTPTAWEWMVPLVGAVALIAWCVPTPLAALGAGALAAWALALPGMKDPSWRIGIGASVFLLAFLMWIIWGGWRSGGAARVDRSDRATRISELLVFSAAFGGLAGVIIASGFEKLTTNMAAVAMLLAASAAIATMARAVRIGGAGIVVATLLLVSGAAIASAYGSDDFKFWHWLVAIAAPLAAVAAELPVGAWRARAGVRALVRVTAVAIVAFGNAAMALGPLVARGEFPPK